MACPNCNLISIKNRKTGKEKFWNDNREKCINCGHEIDKKRGEKLNILL